MQGKIKFEEHQNFRFTWSWFLLYAINIGVIVLFGRGAIQQLINGEPWGDNPMSDSGMIFTLIFLIVVLGGATVFIEMHKLSLQIDQGTIRYRYIPYFSSYRTVRKEALQDVYVRKYNPVTEFGGWGYRIGFGQKIKAFNVSGNWGLQLDFKDGHSRLIGTRRPGELDDTIKQLKENWERT